MKNKAAKQAVFRKFINIATAASARLHIIVGNSKVGTIPYFSINPGQGFLLIESPASKHYGEYVGNMPGSCAGVCQGCGNVEPGKKCPCYAINDCKRHNNSAGLACNDNTYLAMREPARLADEINAWLAANEPRYFRIHEAGEFFSYRYFLLWIEIIRNNPETRFYFYTKHSDYLARYAAEYGELPGNLAALVSIWHDTVSNPTGAAEFIYDDGTEEYVKYIRHCPAVDANGHKTGVTCAQCKMCMRAKPGDKIAVYAH